MEGQAEYLGVGPRFSRTRPLRGVAQGAIARLGVPPGQGHGIFEAQDARRGAPPAVPASLCPRGSWRASCGTLAAFSTILPKQPSSGMGYHTDKNRRLTVVSCIEARPDPCVSGHGGRI